MSFGNMGGNTAWSVYPVPKKTIPLTDTQIKNAKPKKKEYNLYDGDGLAVRIKPTGSKTLLQNYYHPITRKRTNIKLGTYLATGTIKSFSNIQPVQKPS